MNDGRDMSGPDRVRIRELCRVRVPELPVVDEVTAGAFFALVPVMPVIHGSLIAVAVREGTENSRTR